MMVSLESGATGCLNKNNDVALIDVQQIDRSMHQSQ